MGDNLAKDLGQKLEELADRVFRKILQQYELHIYLQALKFPVKMKDLKLRIKK